MLRARGWFVLVLVVLLALVAGPVATMRMHQC